MGNENERLELAWRLVEETGANVFLTGKAGTGKTTFLRRLKEESSKTIAVLAPTGIAAINAGGMTIHSFFQLSFSPFIPGVGQAGKSRFDRYSKQKIKTLRSIDVIVIDEISMVRADVLDAIDSKLRKYRNPALPMGGVQLVMIGDLQQLPPVVREEEWRMLSEHYASPYFFDSHFLRTTPYETIELTKVYRQKDSAFIDILNAIRENRAGADVLQRLNKRYIAGFNPADDEGYIRLMTHNYQAQQFNDDRMSALPGKAYVLKADIEGDFPDSMYPVDSRLILKKGAQVMFVKNDSSGSRLYYNGLIGRIRNISDEGKIIVETDESPYPIEVDKEIWENTAYEVDSKAKVMKEKVVGRFSQVPLRAAWAITIHKSQGLTFEHAIINATEAFAHGQTYVALSRCRSLEGLVLERPLPSSAIICDSTVKGYIDDCASRHVDAEKVALLQKEFDMRLLLDLVDLNPLRTAMEILYRAMQDSHLAAFPKSVEEVGLVKDTRLRNLVTVSVRFQEQLRRMMAEGATEERIQERVSAGCNYFLQELDPIYRTVSSLPCDIDSKDAKKKFSEALETMEYEMKLKRALMTVAAHERLSTARYLLIRREVSTAQEEWAKDSAKTKKKPVATNADIENTEVYEKLVRWRSRKAKEQEVAAFMILGNKTLVALANELPMTEDDLLSIPGIGRKKKEEYGQEILALINA